MKNLTVEELITFERLLIENRDTAKLQRLSGAGYLDSITLLNKIRKMLDRDS